ncbi:hypothetical protein Esti_006511 [Eimeria stiedai]
MQPPEALCSWATVSKTSVRCGEADVSESWTRLLQLSFCTGTECRRLTRTTTAVKAAKAAKAAMTDEDYDLYEDLEAAVAAPPHQQQQQKQQQRQQQKPRELEQAASAAPPRAANAASFQQPPISPASSTELTAVTRASGVAAGEAAVAKAAAGNDEEDDDGVLIVGGDANLPLVADSPPADSRFSAGWASQDKGRRAAHYMRRERPLFLGVPPPVLQTADAKPSQLLVISNLPWARLEIEWVNDVSLREMSSTFGRVLGVRLFGDATGAKPGGVALLLFETEQHAAAAAAGLDSAVAAYGGLPSTSRRLRILSASPQIWNSLASLQPHWARGCHLPKDLAEKGRCRCVVEYTQALSDLSNGPSTSLPAAPSALQQQMQQHNKLQQPAQPQLIKDSSKGGPVDSKQQQQQQQQHRPQQQQQQQSSEENPNQKTGISAL